MHIVLVIFLFAMFASLFGLSKATLGFAEPFFVIGARMFFAGLILLAYQFFFQRKNFTKINLKVLPTLLALSFFNIYLTNIAEIWGIQHMVSAKACLIYSLSPFISALFSFFIFGETLARRKCLGLLIGFVGLLPIFYESFSHASSDESLKALTVGELSVLTAVVCSVYGWILLKKAMTEHTLSPLTANGFSMTVGGFFALAHSYASGESWAPVPVWNMSGFLQNALLMTLISNFVCYNLYGFLLKKYTATFMSFAGLVTPLFASLFGWLLLDEKVSWYFFASFALFSLGLWFYHREELVVESEEGLVLTPKIL